ncbi:synaptonemal complex protein 2-like, partial [Polymixia lowei]
MFVFVDVEFELRVQDCLNHKDSTTLVSVLRKEGLSRMLVTRIDKMFIKLLYVVCWFEAVRGLLICDLYKDSGRLLSLTEEFYDYFLVRGSVCLLSSVLLQLARLVLETGINFGLRLEAIRTYNSILESLGREERRQLQLDTSQYYELQVSLSEALCRLTPRKDREKRANHWFSSHDITYAFCNMRDREFEVDCRCFLNYINCFHGDQRRVYTFPCLRAFLDSTELFRPEDDKLDQFWIDFNLGSECVSFFIDNPQ